MWGGRDEPAGQDAGAQQDRAVVAPYRAPRAQPITTTRWPGLVRDDARAVVPDLLRRSGLSARPDLVFGAFQERHGWVVLHVADAATHGPAGPPVASTELPVGDGEPDVRLALAFALRAGLPPERHLGIVFDLAAERPAVRVLHLPDARVDQAVRDVVAATEHDVPDGARVERVAATGQHDAGAVLAAYVEVVGLQAHDCYGLGAEGGVLTAVYRDAPDYAAGRERWALYRAERGL